MDQPKLGHSSYMKLHHLVDVPADGLCYTKGNYTQMYYLKYCYRNKKDCESESGDGKQDRLADELIDQLEFLCPHDFSQPDFLEPNRKSGGAKVHVVDAGDDQNDECDEGE